MLKEIEKLHSGIELNILPCFRHLYNLQEIVCQPVLLLLSEPWP